MRAVCSVLILWCSQELSIKKNSTKHSTFLSGLPVWVQIEVIASTAPIHGNEESYRAALCIKASKH